MTKENLHKFLFLAIFLINSLSFGQSLTDFLGHWTGLEELNSPAFTYENRNISIQVTEGGERDGYYIYSSSCDFLFNEDLSWAYHYIGFDKENTQIIFLRRFITPLGVLAYEEIIYDLTEWGDESFVGEHTSSDGTTFHQIRMDINLLGLDQLIPCDIKLSQNYPNPFNPSTSIYVEVDNRKMGALNIYNLNGQKVVTLFEGVFQPGATLFEWNGRDSGGYPVSAGTYIYRLMVDGYGAQSQKMVLLK